MIKSRFIVPSILSLISLYWLWMAVTRYGIWHEEGPKGGFMPMIAALVTLGFCVAEFVKGSAHHKKLRHTVFIPEGVILVLLASVSYLGLLPAMWCMLLLWVRYLERYSLPFALAFSSGVVLVVWLVFRLWLSVPFPTGLLGF